MNYSNSAIQRKYKGIEINYIDEDKGSAPLPDYGLVIAEMNTLITLPKLKGINLAEENEGLGAWLLPSLVSKKRDKATWLWSNIDKIGREDATENGASTLSITVDGKSFAFAGILLSQKFTAEPPAGIVPIYAEGIKRGRTVLDIETHPLAILVDNILMVYTTLSDSETIANTELKKYVLQKALEAFDFTTYRAKPNKKDVAQMVVAELIKYKTSATNKIDNDIKSEQRAIREYSENLAQSYKRMYGLMEAQRLAESGEGISTEIERLSEKLIKYPDIEAFRITNHETEKVLELEIANLIMTKGKEKITLPKYLVRVFLDRPNLRVKLNESGFGSLSKIHPHIFDNRDRLHFYEVCLGNYDTIFAKIVGGQNFSQLVDLVLQFLRSYNPDSPTISFERYKEQLDALRSGDAPSEEESEDEEPDEEPNNEDFEL